MSAVLERPLTRSETRLAELRDFGARVGRMNLEDDGNFQTLLFEARMILELTDLAIAEALRVSRPTVNRWIRGKNLPHPALRASIMKWVVDAVVSRIKLVKSQGVLLSRELRTVVEE
jgi:hypothetical protein